MSDTQLITIVAGLIALCVIVLLGYYGRKWGEIATAFGPLLDQLVQRADVALADYGTQLAPAHALFAAALTLIDEDSDVLAKHLSADLRKSLLDALTRAEQLTDGKPEAVPLAEREQGGGADAAES